MALIPRFLNSRRRSGHVFCLVTDAEYACSQQKPRETTGMSKKSGTDQMRDLIHSSLTMWTGPLPSTPKQNDQVVLSSTRIKDSGKAISIREDTSRNCKLQKGVGGRGHSGSMIKLAAGAASPAYAIKETDE